ncbi:hypothetical protein SAY87_006708 [Trapa incisa]|uniref:Uncharacterized protein n=1 Tax=Trapa incisa TaxID=236973 RepID=A0AAN7JZ35_9MYRT|nr:hypothetical protein SAY87_006708 [Trapa incisa]
MTMVSLIMDAETLEKNNIRITYSVRAILGKGNFDDSFEILNNYDWWKDVKLLGFLENVGRYACVGTMIVKESVKKMLESEQGISYIEFTYQLLHGYDFLHLFQKECINVQDQREMGLWAHFPFST